jgi:hypothetical protein
LIRKIAMTSGRIVACGLMIVAGTLLALNRVLDGTPSPVLNGICGCGCGLAFLLDRQLVRWRKQQESKNERIL